MAGNYPDVPALRMPWDRDGSACVFINSGTPTQQSAGVCTSLNSEALNSDQHVAAGPNGPSNYLCVIFPELRDLVGCFWGTQAASFGSPMTAMNLETSPDTTNGIDGTWNVIMSGTFVSSYPNVDATDHRNLIRSAGSTGIRAVRVGVTYALGASDLWCTQFHLYGTIATGQNPDRIRIWHPTLDQEVGGAYFDQGNVPRGSTLDTQFRLKNNSSTYTANNVVVSIEALTDTSPSVPGQYTFSTGGSYAATQNISSIAPLGTSGLITLRRITPTNATLSLWDARIKAIPTTWT